MPFRIALYNDTGPSKLIACDVNGQPVPFKPAVITSFEIGMDIDQHNAELGYEKFRQQVRNALASSARETLSTDAPPMFLIDHIECIAKPRRNIYNF
jgi:hypothetical protein